VVSAYLQDPQVHKVISVRLAMFIARGGQDCVARAPLWEVPTLLMYAGQDHLVNPAGSRAFASVAPRCVQARCFEAAYHEIFNEPEAQREQVLARLEQWLAEQCPANNG
jgi:alpha-beta hydrolase superfamily lysophospholipase